MVAQTRSATLFYQHLLKHINDNLTEPVGRTQLYPGPSMAIDDACGQLSLTVISAQGTYRGPGDACPLGYETVVEVSLYRCVSGLQNDTQPPEDYQLTADAEMVIRDSHEIAQAVACMEIPESFFNVVNWVRPVSYRSVGPQGRTGGGVWQIRISWGLPWLP